MTLLLLLPLPTLSASAAEPSLALRADAVSAGAGESVSIAIRITENQGLTSLKLKLEYDSTELTLTDAQNGSLFDGRYQASPSNATYPYLMVWVNANAETASGTLITLTFRITEQTPPDTVLSATVSVVEAYRNSAEVTAAPLTLSIGVSCSHTYGGYLSDDEQSHYRECSKCHVRDTSAHTYDAGTVTTPSTHLTPGEKTFLCSLCGNSKTEVIPADPSHSYGPAESCDAEKHRQSCSCGEVIYAAHSFATGIVTRPATESEPGEILYICVACGERKTEALPFSPESPKIDLDPTLLIAIGGGVAVGVIVLLILLSKRRR